MWVPESPQAVIGILVEFGDGLLGVRGVVEEILEPGRNFRAPWQ